jgi:hypothetical protein
VDQNSCVHTITLSGHHMYGMLSLTSKEKSIIKDDVLK